MDNVIPPIGCVKTTSAKEAGFVNFSELIEPVKNIEDCIEKAEMYPNLCNNKNGDKKCKYVVYNDKDHYDYARTAYKEYLKYKESLREKEKDKYLNNSIQLFKNLWLSFSPSERKEMYNKDKPFLLNYCPDEILNNPDFVKFIEDNLNTEMFNLPVENMCWIGGDIVLDNKNTYIGDPTKNNNILSDCGYNMYIIPGTHGTSIVDKTKKMYEQKAVEADRMIKKYTHEKQKANALAKYINNSSNENIFKLMDGMNEIKHKVEIDIATKDYFKNIQENLKKNKQLKEKQKLLKKTKDIKEKLMNVQMIVDSNSTLQQSELDNKNRQLEWSLRYSWDKETVRDNIIYLLSGILVLVSILLMGMILYFILIKSGSKTTDNSKEYKNVIIDLFSDNKKKKGFLF